MLPVIELRGAIPFGVARGVDIWVALGLGVAACVVVAIVLLALLIPVFNLLKRIPFFARFIIFFETKFASRAEKIENKKILTIFIFAMLPIPLTGVWTASAVAVFLGLPYFRSLVAITLGTIISGLLIVGITILCGDYAMWIFHGLLALGVLVLAVIFIKAIMKPIDKTLS